jgi:ubiquinone/menaquinone biosynthesis C-methylase UbiE
VGSALSPGHRLLRGAVLTGERSDRDVELLTRLLELKQGMEVLDAPCGWGRHSNRLAARGCRVVGLDNDPVALDRAREHASAMGVQPDFVEGDLRQLPFEDGRFDALFNWRTSFGFFDEECNRKQLQEIRTRTEQRRAARDGPPQS